MWIFTEHILTRMNERNVSEEEILQIMNDEVPTVRFDSDRFETVELVFGHVNGKYLLIPFDRIE